MKTAVAFALFSLVLSAQEPQAGAPMPAAAKKAADLIGAAPLIEKLRTTPAASVEELILRQRILEAVTSASLDVDTVTSEIQNEWSELEAAVEQLQNRRDRSVDRLNVANAVLGDGVSGVLSNAMQISAPLVIPGLAVAVAAGGAGSLVYAMGLHARKGPERRVEVAPAMLAAIFGRPTEPGCDYPPDVWAFLNAPPEGYGPQTTLRELLIGQWAQEGRIDLADPAKARQKIGFLTAAIDGRGKLSIQDLWRC
jgi:hypothetical protein